jgi:hypothetical protein
VNKQVEQYNRSLVSVQSPCGGCRIDLSWLLLVISRGGMLGRAGLQLEESRFGR